MKNQTTRSQAGFHATLVAVSILFILLMFNAGLAAIPSVSNIQVQQRVGSTVLDISYDLHDADGDAMHVSAVVSVDGGSTWTVPCRAVSGAVGPMIYSASGLTFEWDAGEDLLDFVGDHCQVRIFATDVFPYPEMEYFRIVQSDTLPMSSGVPDTLAFGLPLHLIWRASTPVLDGLPSQVIDEMDTVWPFTDGLLGYKWQLMEDGCNPELTDCWHPRYYDSATGDSVSYFAEGNQFVFQNNGSGFDPWTRVLESGEFAMRFNTIDIAGTEIIDPVGQDFSFVVNFDPETILLKGETDWAHPEDPEIYPYYTLLNDPEQVHYPFTEGERIPDRSYVVFKALFKDDARDQVLNPAYTMGVTGNATGLMNIFTGGNYSFNTGASSVDTDPAWDEGINGFYADTLGFMPSPRTEFTFRMVAVDEHGRRDGTPPEMSFQVGYPPCVQCLELLPNIGDQSQYSPDLACYDPDAGSHPCFGDASVFYIRQQGAAQLPDRSYMEFRDFAYMGIHKSTGLVSYSDSEFNPSVYYSFLTRVFSMAFLLQGQDDSREAWNDPLLRMMGWQYQVDYDCDPYNSIADGGGIDNIHSPTWGLDEPYAPGLEISPIDGVWRMTVDIVVPEQLVQLGPENFRAIIQYTMADGDAELADELFNKCIRQLSSGTVQAIALDQTRCGYFPQRPAQYHVFSDVRPPLEGPGSGTWRDCDPQYGSVDFSIEIFRGTMASLESVPVENNFQIIFQGMDDDFGCQADLYTGRLALPAWDAER
jgi:hypothetical protein